MRHLAVCIAGFLGFAALSAGILIAAEGNAPRTTPLGALAPAGSPQKNWTADNGNGTYTNPLFYEEFEDPDVIRVGDTYYLAGTTMHMMPAVQLMESKDLVNWTLAGYCGDKLDFGPEYRLEGGRNIYGRGIWAPCLRYHNGTFYVFTNVNNYGLIVWRSKSFYGPWESNRLPGRHDLSVLFDDDLNKIFIISGASNPYPIEELAPDLRSFVPNVRHEMVFPPGQRTGEGHHLYKINGKYVDVLAIPGSNTDQLVATADAIGGPWRVDLMVSAENFGVPSQAPLRPGTNIRPNDRDYTLHQGGIVDTPSGEWWAIIMADRGSIGRCVNLVPVTWNNGLPYVGTSVNNLRKAPKTWVKPNTGYVQDPKPAFVHDDNFDSGKLNPHWQWNHVQDDSKWSLTENPGKLRLHSLPAANFYAARNSLCQRPPGPESTMTVELDASGMKTGDTAGLALLNSPYAWIGVVKSDAGLAVQMFDATNAGGARGGARRGGAAAPAQPVDPNAGVTKSDQVPPAKLWLRVNCNFDTDYGTFSWSTDGKEFKTLGAPYTMRYNYQGTFQGVRPSLFHYNTSGQPGGYVDFDNFTVDEPRARTIEREVPVGKTIVLTSGADNSLLAADGANLVSIAAAANAPANAKFQIVDLGKGRVALKTSAGQFVTVDQQGNASIKDLGAEKPSDAQAFQWVTLMRGDYQLYSIANHKYLVATPNTPGPVKASAAGPRPDRKSGAEFKYKVAD